MNWRGALAHSVSWWASTARRRRTDFTSTSTPAILPAAAIPGAPPWPGCARCRIGVPARSCSTAWMSTGLAPATILNSCVPRAPTARCPWWLPVGRARPSTSRRRSVRLGLTRRWPRASFTPAISPSGRSSSSCAPVASRCGHETPGRGHRAARVGEAAGPVAGTREGSYTAKLYQSGVKHMAQKVGEEGLEVALAAAGEPDEQLLGEAADLLFHLLVLLRSRGLGVQAVIDELRNRHVSRVTGAR